MPAGAPEARPGYAQPGYLQPGVVSGSAAPGSAFLSGSGTLGSPGRKSVLGAALLSGSGSLGAGPLLLPPGGQAVQAAFTASASALLTCSYLSARIVIAADTMFPDNQLGTYGAAEAETTVTVPGIIDGTYT